MNTFCLRNLSMCSCAVHGATLSCARKALPASSHLSLGFQRLSTRTMGVRKRESHLASSLLPRCAHSARLSTTPPTARSNEVSPQPDTSFGGGDAQWPETLAATGVELEGDVASLPLGSDNRFRQSETALRLSFTDRLASYLQTSVFVGDVDHARSTLRDLVAENRQCFRLHGKIASRLHLGKIALSPYCILNAEPFNVLLRVAADVADTASCLQTLEDMKSIGIEPDAHSIALTLAAFGAALEEHASTSLSDSLEAFVAEAPKSLDAPLAELETACRLLRKEKQRLRAALTAAGVGGTAVDVESSVEYRSDVVKCLNESQASYPNPYFGAFEADDVKAHLTQVFDGEIEGEVLIPRIPFEDREEAKTPTPESPVDVEDLRRSIREELTKRLDDMLATRSDSLETNLLPYINTFSAEELVEMMTEKSLELDHLNEHRARFGVTKSYSFEIKLQAYRLGRLLADRSAAKQRLKICDLSVVEEAFSRYADFLCAPHRAAPTERHFWNSLKRDLPQLGDLEVYNVAWPRNVVYEVGCLAMEIIERVNVRRTPKDKLYTVAASPHGVYALDRLEFRAHDASGERFRATEMPARAPPLPWLSPEFGGNVLNPNHYLWVAHYVCARRPNPGDNVGTNHLKSAPERDHFPVLDAMNHLASCPWRVSGPILDVAHEVLRRGSGDRTFDLRPHQPKAEAIEEPRFASGMERETAQKARLDSQRQWCRATYKLSQAEQLRHDAFWYPYQVEFRGRVQPVPPYLHLIHMDDDLSRGLLRFGNGKPLGPKGLDWLKVHVVNLNGLKRMSSNEERLFFAEEIMDEILDSARRPLDGRGWWTESERPWQTLAACQEIAAALDSPDPERFVSHLPVHQDGTCNGLQHLAAMAGDLALGESVNLGISSHPRDLYTEVAEMVEQQRQEDARNGVRAARLLEGFVSRRVLKRTVLTYFYGVSNDGAYRQITENLLGLEGFSKSRIWNCSYYLGRSTLGFLRDMFPAAERTRNWIEDVATLVVQSTGNPVTWVSPLGMPVMQPYFGNDFHADAAKQRKRFVSNLIVTLESSHMMLTALRLYRRGVAFAAVHDCFWTHAADVDVMNEVSRDEFVNLHSRPLLEDLATHLASANRVDGEIEEDSDILAQNKLLLKKKLNGVPKRGNLDLEDVRKSLYFFS